MWYPRGTNWRDFLFALLQFPERIRVKKDSPGYTDCTAGATVYHNEDRIRFGTTVPIPTDTKTNSFPKDIHNLDILVQSRDHLLCLLTAPHCKGIWAFHSKQNIGSKTENVVMIYQRIQCSCSSSRYQDFWNKIRDFVGLLKKIFNGAKVYNFQFSF